MKSLPPRSFRWVFGTRTPPTHSEPCDWESVAIGNGDRK
jgi:hypothetical protein